MNRPCFLLLTSMGLLFAAPALGAEEPVDAPAVEQSSATPAAIAGWIKQLDSRDYQVRNQATEKLVGAGRPAVEAVARAAGESKSLEVTSRCIAVLGKLHAMEDESLHKATTEALEKLAQSENPAAARRAVQLVQKKEEANPAAPNPFGIQINQIQVNRGGRVRIQNNNGDRTIEAEEDGKKIKIQQDATGKIKMTVTEKVDGKEKTSEYEAKNEEELKKQHPDAHKIFAKYNQQGRGAIRAVGRIQIQAVPGGVFPRIINPAKNQEGLKKISEAQQELKQATETLRKLAEAGASAEQIQQVAKSIESATQKLAEAQKQLAP